MSAVLDAAPVIFAAMVALIPIGALLHHAAKPSRYRVAGTRNRTPGG